MTTLVGQPRDIGATYLSGRSTIRNSSY